MDRLLVEFLPQRDHCGGISLVDAAGRKVCGPFSVAGRASDTLAAANGNPVRDSLQRYGDTPTGSYVVRGLLKTGKSTIFSETQFGPHGAVILTPISGAAAWADANGRFRFLIIGGDLSPDGRLRSTAGALRLRNDDQRMLLAALRKRKNVRCEIVERARLADRGSVFDDLACEDHDPPRRGDWAGLKKSSDAAEDAVPRSISVERDFAVSFVSSQEIRPIPKPGPSAEQTTLARPKETATAVSSAHNHAGTKSHPVFNKDAFVKHMTTHAASSALLRQGDCAQACREGLRAGGLDTTGVDAKGKDFGPVLRQFGFSPVSPQGYRPEKGDVAVFSGNETHKNGHVQVWDGTQWVSDFKNRVGQFSPYARNAPDSSLFRYRDNK